MTTWGDPVPRGKTAENSGQLRNLIDEATCEKARRADGPVDSDTAPADQKGIADKPEGGADSQKK